jgi:hypothetical protein
MPEAQARRWPCLLGAMSTEHDSNDAWSPTLVTVSAIGGLALVLLMIRTDSWTLLAVPGLVLFVLTTFVSLCWLCYDLTKRRFRHALSIFAAITTAGSIIYCAPLVAQGRDSLAFYAREAEFELQVEKFRAHRTVQEPMQIVVDYQDRSPFVAVNSFYYVVYDETDGKGPYKADFWPYAGSSTGVTAVDVPATMHHLTGHFYDVTSPD